MSRFLAGLFGLLLVAGAAEFAAAQPASLGPTLPPQRILNRYRLERAWWAQAVLNPSRDKLQYLTIDEQVVYVQATSGVVTAFDNETGERLWSHLVGLADQQTYPITSNESLALVVNGMYLFALDKFSGELRWQLKLPRFPSTRPSIDDRAVYIGSLDGRMYAFELRRIDELYQEHLLPQWTMHSLLWQYQTGGEITAPAVSSGRLVHFASRNGSLYAVTADRAQRIFQFETDGPVSAPIVQANGLLFLPSEDFKLYCLNAENGLVQWAFPTGLPIRKMPVVVGEDVFVVPDRGGLFCLQMRTGKERWWKPDGAEFLAATPERVFVSDRQHNIVIVDRQDGTELGALPLRRFEVYLSNDRTDRLYVATRSGLVVCIREQGREFPLYHKHPELRPILPEFAEQADAQPSENGSPPPRP